jgi:hypothetical protein
MRTRLLTLALAILATPAAADTLSAVPESVALVGRDDARQLVITAKDDAGRERDQTGSVRFEVADPKVARVEPGGRVVPLADGTTEIVAIEGRQRVAIPVKVAEMGVERPVSFPNQVVPIFSKFGCNSGGCHGKASGQNGFRLSLFGFDPSFDYETLVKEDRGRRLFVAAPDQSLLLRKAVGLVPHGGGKRFDVSSDEYRLIRRWIATGMAPGRPDDKALAGIRVFPEHRIAARRDRQQLAVLATYSDGSVEDITRRAQYESNATEVAAVDAGGLVQTLSLSGEAAIMVRYQGRVAVFRATVPLEGKPPSYEFPIQTLVDRFTDQKWRELGLTPSDPCTDAEFLRRASLDITGTLPTADRVRAFEADGDPEKRSKLIDELLDAPEYPAFFAHKWADVLRVKRGNQPDRAFGTFAFSEWLRDAIASDMPYDEFARAVLGALGDPGDCPPTVWYRDLQRPEQMVDDAAQVFLGQRLACAQCHHHPYEKWGQDDYWGLAAFFGRVGRKQRIEPGFANNNGPARLAIFNRPNGNVVNKRTGQAAVARVLDGPPVQFDPDDDPRQKLVDWMVAPENPYFARAVVNRYWAHFFGRGIVEPIDDLRVTNPPTNAPLLDALAQDLIAHRYSLKHLIGVLCKSRTYGLSPTPNDRNRDDRQSFARFYPRRVPAEVLFDAICQVTSSLPNFNGLPADRLAPNRAILLPDESFASYFLDVFGRPKRTSACECERISDANLAQVLHMLNSEEIQGKVSRAGGRAAALAADPRPDADKVAELFLSAFARPPSPSQLSAALAHLDRHAKDKKAAYEDILWSLLNAKEFLFNR